MSALNGSVKAQRAGGLAVLTQNIWGGVPGWEHRRLLLARAIGRHRPDVIGLQEVHARPAERHAAGARGAWISQAHELAAMLGGYTAHFAPGRLAASGAAEGVALLCKGTVREHAVHALTLDGRDVLDRNQQRVVLCATIESEAQNTDSVDVFVTHLSLSRRARRRTVSELLAFAAGERRRSGSAGAVLLGDFNAPSEEQSIAEIEHGAAHGSPWRDVWKAAQGAAARGGTWPAWLPMRRLDYVFVQPSEQWSVEGCDRIGFAGSDHLGVLARFSFRAGPENGEGEWNGGRD